MSRRDSGHSTTSQPQPGSIEAIQQVWIDYTSTSRNNAVFDTTPSAITCEQGP